MSDQIAGVQNTGGFTIRDVSVIIPYLTRADINNSNLVYKQLFYFDEVKWGFATPWYALHASNSFVEYLLSVINSMFR